MANTTPLLSDQAREALQACNNAGKLERRKSPRGAIYVPTGRSAPQVFARTVLRLERDGYVQGVDGYLSTVELTPKGRDAIAKAAA